jgi:DNA-binding winged helix-turn-helix (wHTH) protein
LAANAGRVITRDEILDALWGSDYVADSNVVDRHVRNLRTQLGDDWRTPRFIATVPGRGYRFIPPLERPTPSARFDAATDQPRNPHRPQHSDEPER